VFQRLTKEPPLAPFPRVQQRGCPARLIFPGILRTATAFPAHHERLGSAAHDLKTPLSILNGYVELLQSEKLGPLSERQREVLRDMQASGKRLQQFIQDFSPTAPSNRRLKMHYATGNINQCLSDVCRLWSTRFQERDWLFTSCE